MKKFLVTSISLLVIGSIHAQDSVAVAKVVDETSLTPLAFTNIGVMGKSTGTVSNIDGQFVLSLKELAPTDTVMFSHIGYKVAKFSIGEIDTLQVVKLSANAVNLAEFQVSSRNLKVKEILELIEENFSKNHPKMAYQQRIFMHKFNRTPFDEGNKIEVKRSSFDGLDKKLMNKIMSSIPKELIEYQDVIFDYYAHSGSNKFIPVKGVTLQEGSQDKLLEDAEKTLNNVFKDIENTHNNPDIYYKLKSGIFGFKLDSNNVSSGESEGTPVEDYKKDSTHIRVSSSNLSASFTNALYHYGSINSDYLEFITKPGRYKYQMNGVKLYNNELVYHISFTGKSSGMFNGSMLVNTSNFALLQLDFSMKPKEKTESFKLLGIGHNISNIRARVHFEKLDSVYYIKYLNYSQDEYSLIDRPFSIVKKQKRFLFDKELKEIAMHAHFELTQSSQLEILVLDCKRTTKKAVELKEEPTYTKLEKKFAYNKEMWNKSTVIAPSDKLKEFKRTQEEVK